MERSLARYLRLATWGLPHKKKLEIQQELLGNIEILSLEYQVQGMNTTQALNAALLDFGKPERVCVGMTKVYTMPVIIRNIGLAALLSSLGIGILSTSTAQIIASVTGRLPISTCADGQTDAIEIGKAWIPCEGNYGIWIHLPSLKATLEPLGVKVSTNQSNPWLETKINFPKGINPVIIKNQDNQPLPIQGEQVKISPEFVEATTFFASLNAVGLPIRLTTKNNLEISVGETKFPLHSVNNTVSNEMLLSSAFTNVFLKDLKPTRFEAIQIVLSWQQDLLFGTPYEHRINIQNVNAQDIFVVATRQSTSFPNTEISTTRIYRIVQPNSKGVLRFSTLKDKLTFAAKDIAELALDGQFSTSEVIVYKFTNRLEDKSFEIIPAKDIQILTK